jgi:F-type H+-transporting ATPase subunit epsilon
MAEQDQIAFELVSPEQLVVSENADMVVIPGADGDIGAMARHAPLITSLKAGVVGLYDGRSARERYFVAGGFAEITNERCTVLAEYPTKVAELDRSAVETELKNAQEDVADAKTDQERSDAERRVEVADAKLRAIQAAQEG